MPSKRARPSRSPSVPTAAAATTSATDQRVVTIRTARLLCRFAALACLAQALWGGEEQRMVCSFPVFAGNPLIVAVCLL